MTCDDGVFTVAPTALLGHRGSRRPWLIRFRTPVLDSDTAGRADGRTMVTKVDRETTDEG